MAEAALPLSTRIWLRVILRSDGDAHSAASPARSSPKTRGGGGGRGPRGGAWHASYEGNPPPPQADLVVDLDELRSSTKQRVLGMALRAEMNEAKDVIF